MLGYFCRNLQDQAACEIPVKRSAAVRKLTQTACQEPDPAETFLRVYNCKCRAEFSRFQVLYLIPITFSTDLEQATTLSLQGPRALHAQ